jgi:hypothetical protein
MLELLYRFLVGGTIVTLFAVTGDVLKPKSFAGLFGAAPSVALATLSLTILTNGKSYAALEARSMGLGALCFFAYACVCAQLLKRWNMHALLATTSGLALWLLCAFAAWVLVLK